MPDVSLVEPLAADDSSSSDSEPGPGDMTGGGGGTGRDSDGGRRGGTPVPGAGGTALRSCGGGGNGRDSANTVSIYHWTKRKVHEELGRSACCNSSRPTASPMRRIKLMRAVAATREMLLCNNAEAEFPAPDEPARPVLGN